MRKIALHPMHYFFLATSFFAFHLLLAYLVDHMSIHLAFVLCSAVSVFLVVSYLRLVVGPRFAVLEAGVATTLQCGRGAPGLFASHGTTLVVIEALVLGIAATHQAASEASLTKLNELRASLAGRRMDVDSP